MRKRLWLRIYGRVQGVFFRHAAQKKMQELSIRGWVRNCEDGCVETEIEGEEGAVEQYRKWCRQGPPLAQVERVEEINYDSAH